MNFLFSTILNETTWILFCFALGFFIKEASRHITFKKQKMKIDTSYMTAFFLSFGLGMLLNPSRTMFLFFILFFIELLYRGFKKGIDKKEKNIYITAGIGLGLLAIFIITQIINPALLNAKIVQQTTFGEILSFFAFLSIGFPSYVIIRRKVEGFKKKLKKPLSFMGLWLLRHVGLSAIKVAIFVAGSLLIGVEYKHFFQWLESLIHFLGISAEQIRFIPATESLATSENLASLELLKETPNTQKTINDLQIGVLRVPNTTLQIILSFICLSIAYVSSTFLQFAFHRKKEKKEKRSILQHLKKVTEKPYFMALSFFFLMIGIELAGHFLHSHSIVNIFLFIVSVLLLNKFLWKITHSITTSISVLFLFFGYAILKIAGYFEPLKDYIQKNIISEVHFDTYALELGSLRISLYDTLIIVGLFFLLKMLLRVKNVYISESRMHAHNKELLKKLFGFILYFSFIMAILNVLGIKIAHLAIFSGALGVGLGFGLRNITTSYLGGILILLENTLRIGDIVKVDENTIGTIKKLSSRHVRVQTLEGREVLIPNETIITHPFTNITLSKDRMRIDLEFLLNDESDFKKLPDILTKAVQKCTHTLSTPKPKVLMREIIREGVHVQVNFWIKDDAKIIRDAESEALTAIFNAMKKNKIEFFFARKDREFPPEK